MRRFLILGIALCLLPGCRIFGPSPSKPPAAAWQMNEFLIGHWGFPSDEAQLKQFVADGFNTVIAVPQQLPQAQQHGLKALLAADPATAKQYVHDPMIWGYFVTDEPARKKIPYPDIAAKVAPFHQLDPTRPAYVNLNELDDPAEFIRKVHPRVLSYDYYQWWAGQQPFYPLLEKYRKAALDAHIPLIVWAEASAVPNGPRPADNLAKIRLSVYSALAYGAKGIQWWGWRPDNRDVAVVNADLKKLGPELMKLRSVAVYHTDAIPGTQRLPKNHWINVASPGLVIGIFKDEKDNEYAFIVDAFPLTHPGRAGFEEGRLTITIEVEGKTPATLDGGPTILVLKQRADVEIFNEDSCKWTTPTTEGSEQSILLNEGKVLIRVKKSN